MQHFVLITCSLQCTIWNEGTAQLLNITEFKSHLFELSILLAEPLTDEGGGGGGGGNRSTRRKPLTTTFIKYHILKPENSSPKRDSNPQLWHRWQAKKANRLTITPRVAPTTHRYRRRFGQCYYLRVLFPTVGVRSCTADADIYLQKRRSAVLRFCPQYTVIQWRVLFSTQTSGPVCMSRGQVNRRTQTVPVLADNDTAFNSRWRDSSLFVCWLSNVPATC